MYGCNKPFWPLPYAKAYSLELDWILAELKKIQEGEGGTPLESVIQTLEEIKNTLEATVSAPGTVYDAQKLGGVAADQYALKTDTAPNSLKLGGVAADKYALKTDTAPDSLKLGGVAADQYALKTDTAPDSLKLGGVAADQYALKTDTAPDSLKLGGKPVSEYASAESLSKLKDNIGDAWVSGKTYAVGDYCISGNQLYKCKTAHTSGSAFDAAYWDKANVSSEISSVRSTIESKYPIGPGLEIATGSTREKNNIIVNLRDNAESGLVFIIYSGGLVCVYIHKNGTLKHYIAENTVTITKLSISSFSVNTGVWTRFFAICQQNTFEFTYSD